MTRAIKILIHTWFPLSIAITAFAAIANADGWALLCFTGCCTFYGMMIEAIHG